MSSPSTPPVLEYHAALHGLVYYRRAGVMLLSWASALGMAGVFLALLTFILFGAAWESRRMGTLFGPVLVGMLAWALIQRAMILGRVGLQLVRGRFIEVQPIAYAIWRMEGVVYLVGATTLVLSVIEGVRFAIVLSATLLLLAGVLSWTRITLRRVQPQRVPSPGA